MSTNDISPPALTDPFASFQSALTHATRLTRATLYTALIAPPVVIFALVCYGLWPSDSPWPYVISGLVFGPLECVVYAVTLYFLLVPTPRRLMRATIFIAVAAILSVPGYVRLFEYYADPSLPDLKDKPSGSKQDQEIFTDKFI